MFVVSFANKRKCLGSKRNRRGITANFHEHSKVQLNESVLVTKLKYFADCTTQLVLKLPNSISNEVYYT